MGETKNTSEVANKISSEIFKIFHWELHQKHDTNFQCVSDHHTTEQGGKKKTHPEDVVFHYIDPYLNKRVYLHTDLKSYGKSSIQAKKLREALQSLAITIECAAVSEDWQNKFLVKDDEDYEVRGLLFVANHDGKAVERFQQVFKGISKLALPVAPSQIVHVIGPEKITDLFAVASDIQLSIGKTISERYRFLYPDLTLWKRHTVDDVRTGATLETLMSPYFILKHDGVRDKAGELIAYPGSIVYYSRSGETVEEFVYLLDALLRYQLVTDKDKVRVRVFCKEASENIFSNFEKAKHKYCSVWGFHGDRQQEIQSITIDTVSRLAANYSPASIGWREDR